MAFANNKSTAWTRFAIEVAAIVVGILLAFAINTWWGYHSNRAAERDLLSALRNEFGAVAEEIERARQVHVDHDAAAATFLAISNGLRNGSTPNLSLDSLSALGSQISTYTTLDPPRGVLDAMLATGDLRLIRDDSLRILLAQWPSRIEDHRTTEQVELEVRWFQYKPWIRQYRPSASASDYLRDDVLKRFIDDLRGEDSTTILENDRLSVGVEEIIRRLDKYLGD